MKKRFLTVASASMLALSMSFSAIAADPVSVDTDYGAEGQASDASTAWNSAINGQFLIKDGQSVTFTFDSQNMGTDVMFGWVAEITDGTSYFTVTQGATCWFAPTACDWVVGADEGKNTSVIETNWEHDNADSEKRAAFLEASKDFKGNVLVVSRSGNQVEFNATQKGADGTEYTTKVTGVWGEDLTGDLKLQVGLDHGKMTLYSVKYGEASIAEVETEEPTEKKTLKVDLSEAGVGGGDSSSNESATNTEEESGSSTMIIVVVAVVAVVVIAGVAVVATKKKSN